MNAVNRNHDSAINNLNKAYISAIVQAWVEHDFEFLHHVQIPIDLARQISETPAGIVDNICNTKNPLAHSKADCNLLHVLLEQAKQDINTRNKIDKLLALGASYSHLQEMFGWSKSSFTERSRALGIPVKSVRPRRVDAKLVDEALQFYCSLNETLSDADKWISMGEKYPDIEIKRIRSEFRMMGYLDEE